MKTHLNTLYITTEGSYLHKQGESVSVKVGENVRARIPFHNLDGIVCFGNVSASPFLFGACAEAGISVSFLTQYGRFMAAAVGYSPGNVLLRREQYRIADTAERSANIVRTMLLAKIANYRTVFLRAAREVNVSELEQQLADACMMLLPPLNKIKAEKDIAVMRGLEGTAARIVFDHFNLLIHKFPEFNIKGRSRRPPLDPMNGLLSFLYSLLSHDVRSACETVGLDAAVGFLHVDRSGRPGLALDLMEELRPIFGDRLACSLVNRGQIKIDDFIREENGAVRLKDEARKIVLEAYQRRKEKELLHPFLNEKITFGLLPHIQARLLARHIRGDIDAYPAFIWK